MHFRVYIYDYELQTAKEIWRTNDDTSRNSLRHVVWYPNGNRLLLHGNIDDQNGLYFLDLDQEILEPNVVIQTGPPLPRSPAFSRDGRRIYYLDAYLKNPVLSEYGYQMYSIDIDGLDQKRLETLCYDIAIAPNGAMALCDGTHIRNYLAVSLDDWSQKEVTNWSILISGFSEPAWSPDGEYIVYVQTHWPTFMGTHSGELWIMRADGSHPTKLTNGPNDRNPAWRPQP